MVTEIKGFNIAVPVFGPIMVYFGFSYMLNFLVCLAFGVSELIKYAWFGLFTFPIFIPCINQRKMEPFMAGAHPCLMCSQEGDLDNRSYQRHTALCVCACMGVCVHGRVSFLFRILFHSEALMDSNA